MPGASALRRELLVRLRRDGPSSPDRLAEAIRVEDPETVATLARGAPPYDAGDLAGTVALLGWVLWS